jgi:hypothetical protein
MSQASKDLVGAGGKKLKDMTTEELYVEENAEARTVMDRLFGRQTPRQKAAREELERRKREAEGKNKR